MVKREVIIILLNMFLINLQGAVLIHNSKSDINAGKGKISLKLIRVWGGENEKDERKFFKTPTSIAVFNNKQVYICDEHNHHIRVFGIAGNYLRTIGRKGRGPGDLYCPLQITLSPFGDLVVSDFNRRLQFFNPSGKSNRIQRYKDYIGWIGMTSKNELLVFSPLKTFTTKKLISVYSDKGELLRQIGKSYEKSNHRRHIFSMGNDDSFYAANVFKPVIREYSSEGNLVKAITLDTAFDIPAKISLNKNADEISITDPDVDDNTKIIRKKSGVSIQAGGKRSRKLYKVFSGIAVDSKRNIYAITRSRLLTKKESAGTSPIWTNESFDRRKLNFDIVDNIDINKLLVFNPEGKIIGSTMLTTFCDKAYFAGNRLFIVDGERNQRILEYEIIFKCQ